MSAAGASRRSERSFDGCPEWPCVLVKHFPLASCEARFAEGNAGRLETAGFEGCDSTRLSVLNHGA